MAHVEPGDAKDCLREEAAQYHKNHAAVAAGITLTGADELTPILDLIRLADMGAEIGLLYTFSPDGRHRYPSLTWIQDAAIALAGRAALHVCGGRARGALFRGSLDYLTRHVGRVQVNGRLTSAELRSACDGLDGKTVITQHTDRNAYLVDVEAKNHALIVDASGGRGVLPEKWLRPETDKPVGFAGGLGPHNLREQLPRIAAVARPGAWVDMEGRLRDADDWFDVGKAMQVMDIWRDCRG